MGLQNLAILVNGVLAVSGGTSTSFAPTSETVQQGIKLINPAVADLRIRDFIVLKSSFPAVNSDGLFTGRFKQSLLRVRPKLKTDGTISFDSLRIERSVSAETTAVEALLLLNDGAQLLFDADTATFWATGSVA